MVEAADEPIVATRCEEGGPGRLGGGTRRLTHDLWAELGDQIRLFLGAMTLADVVDGRVIGRASGRRPAPNRPPRPRHDPDLALDADATDHWWPEARAAVLAALDLPGQPVLGPC